MKPQPVRYSPWQQFGSRVILEYLCPMPSRFDYHTAGKSMQNRYLVQCIHCDTIHVVEQCELPSLRRTTCCKFCPRHIRNEHRPQKGRKHPQHLRFNAAILKRPTEEFAIWFQHVQKLWQPQGTFDTPINGHIHTVTIRGKQW